MIFFFLFLFILLLILTKGRKFNFNNPLIFMWVTWLSAIVICFLNIFSSYNELSIKTIMYIFYFLILTSVGYLLGKKSGYTNTNNVIVNYNKKRLLFSFNFLFFLVLISYAVTIIRLGLPPALTGGNRSTYYLNNGGEMLYLLIYPCFFLAFYLIKYFKVKYKLSVQLFILTLMLLSKANKMTIFSIIILWLIFFGKQIDSFRIILIIGFVFLIFYLSTFVYTKNISNVNELRLERISMTGFKLSPKLYFLYDPLIYLSSNIYNLNNLINIGSHPFGLGSQSFKGLMQIISTFVPSINVITNNGFLFMKSTLSIPLFNTFSALGSLYYDFGIFFSLIFSFFGGFITGKAYLNQNKNILILYIYYLLFQTLALSFFTFYFGNLEVITNIIVILIIDLACKESRKKL